MAPYSDYWENWFSKHRKVWRNLFILYFVFVKKQRTIDRKKKRSKISGLESCYANRIYVLIGVELRPYGQKLVQFCKHTHTRVSFSSIDNNQTYMNPRIQPVGNSSLQSFLLSSTIQMYDTLLNIWICMQWADAAELYTHAVAPSRGVPARYMQ